MKTALNLRTGIGIAIAIDYRPDDSDTDSVALCPHKQGIQAREAARCGPRAAATRSQRQARERQCSQQAGDAIIHRLLVTDE